MSEHPSLDRLFKGLPDRRAPATLEARVLAQLAAQAALPWWRRRFAEWPLPYSAAFLLLSAALAVLAAVGGRWLAGAPALWEPVFSPLLAVLRPWLVLGNTAGALAQVAARALPMPWLNAALLVGASLYVALFALGATAYRTLYLRPPSPAPGGAGSFGQVKS